MLGVIGRSVFGAEGPYRVFDEDAVERFLARFVTVEEVDEGLVAAADYMHRVLLRERDRARVAEAPAPEDPLECFRRLAETFADARDPEIMAGAWR